MRSTIVSGTFYGGEIEPGTFHGAEIEPGTFHQRAADAHATMSGNAGSSDPDPKPTGGEDDGDEAEGTES